MRALRAPPFVALVLSALVAGCLGVDVPNGAVIACGADADCPATHRCLAARERCVLRGGDDTPPQIDAVTIEPDLLGVGHTTTITLRFSEALLDEPRLELAIPGADARVLALESFDDTRAVLTYQARGDEPDDATLLASLVDTAGTVAEGLAVGALRFDFQPPTVANITSDVPVAGAGDVVAIRFTVDEPLGAIGAFVSIPGGFTNAAATPDPAAQDENAYVAELVIAAADVEGPLAISVSAGDVVDNVGAGGAVVDTVLDFTAPHVLIANATLSPAPGSPLALVSALGSGGTAHVTLVFDEAPSAQPTARIADGAQPALTPTTGAGTTWSFDFVLADGVAAGPHDLIVTARDAVDNEQEETVVVPGFVVDPVAPASPDVAAPDTIVYERVPWGDALGPARFTVRGGGGAVDSDTTVVIARDFANNEIARVALDAGADGLFDLPLGAQDRLEVFLVAVDAAGNTSDANPAAPGAQAARVQHVDWIATLRGKVAGSTFANPHKLELQPHAARGASAPVAEASDASGVVTSDDGGPVTALAVSFRVVGLVATSPVEDFEAVLFDAARDRITGFAGSQAADWHQTVEGLAVIDPEGDLNPGGLGPGLAYDAARDVGVAVHDDETWEWNGASWALVCAPPACTGPEIGGTGSGVTYDAANAEVVVVVSEQALDDITTFTWDGALWTERCGGDTTPCGVPDRSQFSLAYHDALARVVLHGGCTGSSCFSPGGINDTRLWDGAAWTALTGAPGPGVKRAPMVYAPDDGELLLLTDTETWGLADDTDGWHVREAVAPPGTSRATVVADVHGGTALAFTGVSPSEWVGGTWRPRAHTPLATPQPSGDLQAIGYDRARAEVIAVDVDGTTWQWAFGVWLPMTAATGPTPIASYTAIGYDDAHDALVLVELGNEAPALTTLLWSGADQTWTKVSNGAPAAMQPAAQALLLGFDDASNELVLFNAACATPAATPCAYGFDGATWVERAAADLEGDGEPTRGFMLEGDHARGSLVLVGVDDDGLDNDPASWTWTGASWLRHVGVAPNTGEPMYSTFDESRARVVTVFTNAPGDVIVAEWDGAAWTERTRTDPEADGDPVFAGPLVYVPEIAASIHVGSDTVDVAATELRLGDIGPAHVARFGFAAAGLARSAPLDRVTLDWRAGADGASAGASLDVWDRGTFRPTGVANSAGADAPAPMSLVITDAAELARLRVGPEGALLFRARARDGVGTATTSRVATDALALTVRYRVGGP